MNPERKKSTGEYGHDTNEWGLRDESEKMEWEEYYEMRNKKFTSKVKDDE